MATIRKRGNKWQVQIKKIINGKEIRESNTFLTKGEAQSWSVMREAELMESDRKGFIVGNKQTFYDALIKYKEEVTPNKKGARWESYRINFFIETIPFVGELITNIKPTHFAQWRDTRLKQVMTSTVNKELSIMSSVFAKAIKEWGWCSINPISSIEKPKNPKHRDRLMPAAFDKFKELTLEQAQSELNET